MSPDGKLYPPHNNLPTMSTGKLLEFFVRIPKLLPDGSNWVIFKDHFAFAAAAALLDKHLDGSALEPTAPTFALTGPTPLTADQQTEVESYETALSVWQTGEAVLKQAIASTIPDSLFLDVRKELTAQLMWDAVANKREKKPRMVTVDLRRKLQSEKCDESGDVCAHLIKLQTMREDLASMGRSISDEDFTSIILGSIPLSYDTFISTMSATFTLLGSSLSPTNLIDATGDEADRKAIKTPTKSKKDNHDAAFTAGSQSRDGKRSGQSGLGSGSKKPKKDIECFNCHKKGHMKADCWAPVVVLRERDHEDRRARRQQLRQVLRLRWMGFGWQMPRQMLLGMLWRDLCTSGWRIFQEMARCCGMSLRWQEKLQ